MTSRAHPRFIIFGLIVTVLAAPLSARDTLGVFSNWAAFRDPQSANAPLRCYAIAEPDSGGAFARYATIAYWPASRIRGQLHIRLAAPAPPSSTATLSVGSRRFVLRAQGFSLWSSDARMDAAIVAGLRTEASMRLSVGNASASWPLRGAATAMDAAALGCARR